MTDWDRKFARMVAETERHLASVKSQLRSPNVRSSDGWKRSSRRSQTVSPSTRLNKSPSGILRKSRKSSPSAAEAMDSFSPSSKRNVSFEFALPSSSSSNTVAVLAEKIRDQQKDIIALRESLNGMQFYLKQQHNQIMSLKEEAHILQVKMAEGGVGFAVEKKLQQLKEEMSLEIEPLKRKIRTLSIGGVAAGHVTGNRIAPLSDELFESKLKRSEEMSSLHRELASIRSKLASEETKVGSVVDELEELEKQQERLSKTVSEVRKWQSIEDLGKPAKLSASSNQNSQIQRFREILSSLERRLEMVEETALSSNNTSNQSHDKHRNHTHHKTLASSGPMTLTDLNISPIRASTARKLHPLHGGRKKGSINPLYTPPLRTTALERDFSEKDLESESLSGLEGTELDGHTLSCSLELLSDLEVSDDLNSDLVSDSDDTISLSNFR